MKYIDSLPIYIINKNFRHTIGKERWIKIKKKYKKSRCWNCHSKYNLHLHEDYYLDFKTHTLVLQNLITLCEYCHHRQHIRYAIMTYGIEYALNYLNVDIEILNKGYNRFKYRDKFYWEYDNSYYMEKI